jgi:hypothetical protein
MCGPSIAPPAPCAKALDRQFAGRNLSFDIKAWNTWNSVQKAKNRLDKKGHGFCRLVLGANIKHHCPTWQFCCL